MLLAKYRNETKRLIYSNAIVYYPKQHLVVTWLSILTEQKYSDFAVKYSSNQSHEPQVKVNLNSKFTFRIMLSHF